MTVYLDNEYRCHTEPGEGLTAVEVRRLNGKCKAYIEGYRYVPDGKTWIREDGEVFTGAMMAPWKDYEELAEAQTAYEKEELYRTLVENSRLKSENQSLIAQQEAMLAAYAEGVASA